MTHALKRISGLALSVALITGGSALAADPIAVPVVEEVGVVDWTGPYAGLMISGIHTDFDKNCVPEVIEECSFSKNGGSAFGFGGQIGYDYDLGDVVVGVVADGHYYVGGGADTRYLASLRARIGVQPTENGLLYATAGVAVGGFNDTTGMFEFPVDGADPALGYVIGAGYEHLVSDNVSLFGAFNLYKFANAGTFPEGIGTQSATVTQITVGVNMGF